MGGNAGYLFYKDYYDGIDWRNLESDPNKKKYKEKSQQILNLELVTNINQPFQQSSNNLQTFDLKTTYPGLVIGTGYIHETGVEDEFKIGFYFDYTTGLPVITGSSVKGVLRSAFPGRGEMYKGERTAYIKDLLEDILKKRQGFDSKSFDVNSIDVEALENEIFEGIKDINANKERDKYQSIYERDIFHDAFPVKTGSTDGSKLFSDDFLTPHGDNPLKNPTPLKFLKVSPEVTFRFVFDLKDGRLKNGQNRTITITKDEKLNLFTTILFDFGVGAKTNVGYGQFDETAFYAETRRVQREQQERDANERRRNIEEKLNKIENPVEREIARISMLDKDKMDGELTEFYKKLDAFEEKDKKKAAEFIKECWSKNNKWKKQKKNQKDRVQRIKLILGENDSR
ncbi:MAG: type III-B CRISPR module RAMP protein Cmr6 [Desulfamplus sp.]|nr:type III-B CRISPR module RAMP protein Cmr6 [Desulfamplus sp.]